MIDILSEASIPSMMLIIFSRKGKNGYNQPQRKENFQGGD